MIIEELGHRILIVDAQTGNLKTYLRDVQESCIGCIAMGVSNFGNAIRFCTSYEFDYVIIDPDLPDIKWPASPTDALEEIAALCPKSVLIVLTHDDSVTEAFSSLRLGAKAYLDKKGMRSLNFSKILQEIDANGFAVRFSCGAEEGADLHYSGLTTREQEIVDEILPRPKNKKLSESYAELSTKFGIEAESVARYYKSARAKLIRAGLLAKEA